MYWLARMVQYPQHPGEVALVLRGEKGIGKGFFANMIGSLMKQHFTPIASFEQLTGRFNGFMRQCVFLFVDEAFWAGDKRHRSVLQSMITEKIITYEHKGRDPVPDYNRMHLVVASNDEWVVPASLKERRYCVLHVSDAHRQDRSYFAELDRALDAGERGQLLNMLLDLDISRFHPLQIPQNQELSEQKMESLDPPLAFLVERINNGEWRRDESFNNLYQSYIAYCDRIGLAHRKNQMHLGRTFNSLLEGQYRSAVRAFGGKTQRWVWWPTEAVMRQLLDQRYGLKVFEDTGDIEEVAPVEELPY
jgi:hypothetical protein